LAWTDEPTIRLGSGGAITRNDAQTNEYNREEQIAFDQMPGRMTGNTARVMAKVSAAVVDVVCDDNDDNDVGLRRKLGTVTTEKYFLKI
jgi:hypothetical protein